MREIVVMTPEEGRFGFAMTGVRQQVVAPEEAWAALVETCADATVGVVAVDARLQSQFDPRRLRELTDHWGGVLVTLPAPAGAERPEVDELQRLVRRALGYHVRIEP